MVVSSVCGRVVPVNVEGEHGVGSDGLSSDRVVAVDVIKRLLAVSSRGSFFDLLGERCGRLFPELKSEAEFGEAGEGLRLMVSGVEKCVSRFVRLCSGGVEIVSDVPVPMYRFKETRFDGYFGNRTSCKVYTSGGRACFKFGFRTLAAMSKFLASCIVAPTGVSSEGTM